MPGSALIHRAIDLGIDHFDSSDMYGWGQNEELLGRALKGPARGCRDRLKFGQTQRPGGANGVDGSPAYIAQACEASLKRLGVDVIDLYYQHRVDPAVPVEETVGAMARLVEQGKVRYLGLCEARPERIRRAHAVHPIAAVQSEFSLLYREEATETRELTRDLGIAFVAYAPLGRSLLAGVVPDFANLAPGRHARPPPALHGREFRQEPGTGRTYRGDRQGEELHPGAALPRLASGARTRRDPDPRHQANRAAGGEYRRIERAVDRRPKSTASQPRSRSAPPPAPATPKAACAGFIFEANATSELSRRPPIPCSYYLRGRWFGGSSVRLRKRRTMAAWAAV